MLGADYIRVLYVDLTKEKVSVEERKDLFHLLGGTGVAAKLLEENMHPELPALHEDQTYRVCHRTSVDDFPRRHKDCCHIHFSANRRIR